jgi:FAD/FMN-containing dehydrogenase
MTGSDFSAFQRLFKGELVTPSDPDYAASIARWAINAERRAKIVAFVKDEEDVALALKYARENMLPLAVRGGGHSSSGASSSENGLVIDLSRHLNGVRIDAENKLAYVGGGAIWESVDKAAIEHGLAAVAGSVNHVSALPAGPAHTVPMIKARPASEGPFEPSYRY